MHPNMDTVVAGAFGGGGPMNLAQRLYQTSKREQFTRGWVRLAQALPAALPIGGMDASEQLEALELVSDARAREVFRDIIDRTEGSTALVAEMILLTEDRGARD